MTPRAKKVLTRVVAAVLALGVLAFAAVFVYVKFIKEDAPPALSERSLDSALDATTTVPAGATVAPTAGIDGTWNVAADSIVGYRVTETLAGLDTVGAGRTSAITGTMTVAGTTVTATDLTVDMATFKSDDSRRDGQFNGRIMRVDQFPTATFSLTAPVDLGSIPAGGASVTVQATGDLTLHGVTRPVTFDLTAKRSSGRVGVVGSTEITFADYSIDNPSNGFAETGDTGTLELQLLFDPA